MFQLFQKLSENGENGENGNGNTQLKKYKFNEAKCSYNGSVSNKIPHGRGELSYPDGSVFEGEFDQGCRNGVGKIIFSSNSYAFGSFIDDFPDETKAWKIYYINGDEYFGPIKVPPERKAQILKCFKDVKERDKQIFKKPKKQTLLEYVKKKTGIKNLTNVNEGIFGDEIEEKEVQINPETDCFHNYFLEIEDFCKHGKGELLHKSQNVKYHGNFEKDKKSGFGVCINYQKGERYYGSWQNDCFHGDGSFLYYDGSFFHGNWKFGLKNGNGDYLSCNGDVFRGIWVNDKIKEANFTKGSLNEVSIPTVQLNYIAIKKCLKKNELVAISESKSKLNNTMMKWICLVDITKLETQFIDFLKTSQQFIKSSDYSVPQVYSTKTEDRSGDNNPGIFLSKSKDLDEEITYINDSKQKKTPLPKEVAYKIKDEFTKMINDDRGYINEVIKGFVTLFQVFYLTGEKRDMKTTLIPHAKDDLYSFTVLLSEVLNDILRYEEYATLKPMMNSFRQKISNCIQTRSYEYFFPLYTNQYEERDLLLVEKLKSLSVTKVSVGIDSDYFPQDTEKGYLLCIELLNKLKERKSALEKIDLLCELRNMIKKQMDVYYTMNMKIKNKVRDEKKAFGMDEMTPVFSYIFCKCQLTDHFAQFHYIQDWKENSRALDDAQGVLMFYEGFFEYVNSLDPNLKTEDGQLISFTQIATNLKYQVEMLKKKQKKFSFYWIPQLFTALNVEVFSRTEKKITLDKDKYSSLVQAMIKEKESVQEIIFSCSKNLGFTVEFENIQGITNVNIIFKTFFPTHIYALLNEQSQRLLKYSDK